LKQQKAYEHSSVQRLNSPTLHLRITINKHILEIIVYLILQLSIYKSGLSNLNENLQNNSGAEL